MLLPVFKRVWQKFYFFIVGLNSAIYFRKTFLEICKSQICFIFFASFLESLTSSFRLRGTSGVLAVEELGTLRLDAVGKIPVVNGFVFVQIKVTDVLSI